MLLQFPPEPNNQNERSNQEMTIVVQPETPKTPARRGNGKTAKEMLQREERRLAIQQIEARAREAQSEADSLNKVREIRAAQRALKFDRYEQQEQKRASQFQIDQKATIILLLALTAVTFLATAVLTADGTIGAAAAAEFISPQFAFILFGAYEVAILVFMLLFYVIGSRIDDDGNPIPAVHWFVAMVVASSLTAMLSVYHVLDIYNYEWTNIDMWVGVIIRLSVAVFFVIVSKGAASALFAKAVNL